MPRITQVDFLNGPMKSTICIHSSKQGEPRGEIYNHLLKQPIVFTDIISMLNQMDALFDQTKCPQNYHQYRSFGGQQTPQELELMNGVKSDMDSLLENKVGEKATFIIQVQFRQNSSWQGTITWTEKKKTLRYRSTLEMLKLMDSALAADGEVSSAPDWNEQVSGG
mgnify:FL=1